jgi:hypothetical protein
MNMGKAASSQERWIPKRGEKGLAPDCRRYVGEQHHADPADDGRVTASRRRPQQTSIIRSSNDPTSTTLKGSSLASGWLAVVRHLR